MIWTPERQETARKEAREWAGTPHFDRMRKKGVGVDCINFVAAIYEAAGIFGEGGYVMPAYSPRLGLGRRENIMERIFIENLFAYAIGERDPWEFGDIVIFKVGRYSNHVGIFLDGVIWHSMARHLVEPFPVVPSTFDRIQSVVRLTAEGFRKRPETITPEDFRP